MPAIEPTSRQFQSDLGLTIQAYWARRGYRVNVFVTPIPPSEAKRTGIGGWKLQTDLVSGVPAELVANRRTNTLKVKGRAA